MTEVAAAAACRVEEAKSAPCKKRATNVAKLPLPKTVANDEAMTEVPTVVAAGVEEASPNTVCKLPPLTHYLLSTSVVLLYPGHSSRGERDRYAISERNNGDDMPSPMDMRGWPLLRCLTLIAPSTADEDLLPWPEVARARSASREMLGNELRPHLLLRGNEGISAGNGVGPVSARLSTAPVHVMTEEVIKEVIITSTHAPAASESKDQLMSSADTIYANSVAPDFKRMEKPVPHYLRASSRSCHDNCKYGTHHSRESKKNWPVLRQQLRSASTGNQEIDKVEIMLPQRARPSKDQKPKVCHVKDGDATAPAKPEPTTSMASQEIVPGHSESTPCMKDLPAEAPEPVNLPSDAECFVISHDDVADSGDGESSVGAESIELEMPLAIQDSDASDENMDDSIVGSENPHKDEILPQHQKVKKSTPHLKAAVADSEISSEPKPMRARANASVTTPTKFSRQKKISSTVTSAVPKAKEIKVPLPSNATEASAKPARLAKLKVPTAKDAPSSSFSSEKQTDRKLTIKNVAKNALVLQKQREEKIKPRTLKLSRSINMPAKTISSVKVRTVKKDKIAPPINSSKKVPGTEDSAADAKGAKEKGLKPASLRAKKLEVNSKQSQPRKGTSAPLKSSHDCGCFLCFCSHPPEKLDTPTPRTRTPRVSKPATIPSTSSTLTQSPRKLTFRRGKVLNPDESSSSSTPTRRLRFRPAMAAADPAVRCRGGRVTGKVRSAAGSREVGTSRAEVVVLRRRQGSINGDRKKKEQVLLNYAIEETASRLVAEARKSKVKALVGAFETVISLQEGGKAVHSAAATVAQ
ncbi:hypothetical protein PR202_ga12071 [Eleusine coracana subsp. coracana]|uniref:Calmodulin-binding domain-containing protein n=1 Tax=Eleusine coracana subsp. coracana TaxID=191504 RepID=A0AAV5CB78_ELECO|nr:hypothetical protein PR202_ga12071 [Eleusine coracana subsp. coracana]